MVARDAPISTLDPSQVGTLRPDMPRADRSSAFELAHKPESLPSPQVVEDPLPGLRVVAVRPSWVRVRAADGSVIFEGIMNAGDTYDVPKTEEPPTLRAGESGAVYFAVNGKHYGPAGPRGAVTSNLPLEAEGLSAVYEVADIEQDEDLLRYVAELGAGNRVSQD